MGRGVAVVGRVVAEERDAARDAPAVFGVVAERARGPRVDLHRVEVGDAAPRERGDVLGMFLRGEDRVDRLGHEQRGAHALDRAPLAQVAARHRHDDLDEVERRAGTASDAHLAIDRIAVLPLREVGFGRFVQHDVREQRALRQPAVGAHDLHRALDLGAREHVERVHRCPPFRCGGFCGFSEY